MANTLGMIKTRPRRGLTTAEYRARDYPVKCRACGHWMRFKFSGPSYVKRAKSPNAGVCVWCLAGLDGNGKKEMR